MMFDLGLLPLELFGRPFTRVLVFACGCIAHWNELAVEPFLVWQCGLHTPARVCAQIGHHWDDGMPVTRTLTQIRCRRCGEVTWADSLND